MYQITNLTSEADQKFQITLENGGIVDFRLYYYPTQLSWFFDFTYRDYTCNCQRVVLSPNALRHLKNILPFGIAFDSDDQVEPVFYDDFESERVKMYLLNTDEVLEVEQELYNVE